MHYEFETENVTVETEEDLYIISFLTEDQFPTLDEAFGALRFFIKTVKPLRKSPLGGRPDCVPEGFDQKLHTDVRLVKDEEGLAKYVGYLEGMIAQTPDPHPTLKSTEEMPLYYATARDTARIAIVRHGNAYAIAMTAKFATDPTWTISATLCKQYNNLVTEEYDVEAEDEQEWMSLEKLVEAYFG